MLNKSVSLTRCLDSHLPLRVEISQRQPGPELRPLQRKGSILPVDLVSRFPVSSALEQLYEVRKTLPTTHDFCSGYRCVRFLSRTRWGFNAHISEYIILRCAGIEHVTRTGATHPVFRCGSAGQRSVCHFVESADESKSRWC